MISETDRETEIVWVLGAGFSKALGGPLLYDLISDRSYLEISARRPWEKMPEAARAYSFVWALYHHGSGYKHGKHEKPTSEAGGRGLRLWDNAEDFLEQLDLAADDSLKAAHGTAPSVEETVSPLLRKIRRAMQTCPGPKPDDRPWTIDGIRNCALHIVAAECHFFVQDADVRAEHWRPYRRWAERLTPNDTIVTFNYDIVVETAAKKIHTPLHVLLEASTPTPADHVALLKLHGSIDWEEMSYGLGRSNPAPVWGFEAIKRVLGTPGRKYQMVQELLAPQWDAALAALRTAKAIVFLGYRFPPSDPLAREELLGAITQNSSPKLALHTVLGLKNPDTDRLRGLLEWASGTRRSGECDLIGHNLYAQDFLSVFEREHVLDPAMFAKWSGSV